MKSIHFVCRGNVYRSRPAQAYTASLLEKNSNAKVSSSGIEAEKALNGNVDPETVRILSEEQLEHFLTPGLPTKLVQELMFFRNITSVS